MVVCFPILIRRLAGQELKWSWLIYMTLEESETKYQNSNLQNAVDMKKANYTNDINIGIRMRTHITNE